MLPTCCPPQFSPRDGILLCLEDPIPLPPSPPTASPAGQHGHVVVLVLGWQQGGGQTQHQIWLASPTLPALCSGECARAPWSKARASWWDWLSFISQSSLGSSTCVCVCVPWGRSLPSQHHPGITPALSFTIACMSCFFSWCFEAGMGAFKGNVNLEIAWFAPNLALCTLRDKTNPCPSLLLP